MLNARQKKAIDLLFEMTDDSVAARLGIRPSTLRRWKGKRDFADALNYADRAARESTGRMARGIKTQAAARLREMVAGSGTEKTDAKTLVDLLKTTGVFSTSEEGDANRQLLDFLHSLPSGKGAPRNDG